MTKINLICFLVEIITPQVGAYLMTTTKKIDNRTYELEKQIKINLILQKKSLMVLLQS